MPSNLRFSRPAPTLLEECRDGEQYRDYIVGANVVQVYKYLKDIMIEKTHANTAHHACKSSTSANTSNSTSPSQLYNGPGQIHTDVNTCRGTNGEIS